MEYRQLGHNEIEITDRKFPLRVICENITSPDNVGMIFRISEAMGVEKIIFTGNSLYPPNRKINKVSRSTDRHIPFSYIQETAEVIDDLRAKEFKLIALELTNKSMELTQSNYLPDCNYALIIGSEQNGIHADTLKLVDSCIHIKLFGKNTSINVVSALTIALYEITKQLNR
jgi:tRNA G18 (ribose-2'-O)-methylase SpoU